MSAGLHRCAHASTMRRSAHGVRHAAAVRLLHSPQPLSAPTPTSNAEAPPPLFRFVLDRLPPHLQREFDCTANQRALRHLRRRPAPSLDDADAAVSDFIVAPSSVHPVVWQCQQCRTQWTARPADRSNAQLEDAHRCPRCCGGAKGVAPLQPSESGGGGGGGGGGSGSGLLCELFPQLAAQWDTLRNGILQNQVLQPVTEVRTSCAATVWWRCPLCHTTWREAVANRVARHVDAVQRRSAAALPRSSSTSPSTGDAPLPLCPSCERRGAGSARHGAAQPRRVLADDASLLAEAVLRPHQDPHAISLTSETALQWRCRSCSFEFTATVANRSLRHERCPQCSGGAKTVMNLLVVQRPDVVQEVSRHVSRTRLRHVTIHDDVELPFVCRTCYASYRMTARARCAVPHGVPACSKCFLTSSQVLTQAQQQQHQQQGGGTTALSARARRRVRRKAMELCRSTRHREQLAMTTTELDHRDGALKD